MGNKGVNIMRYRTRIRRSFDVEVVTPMFLGGADTKEAELRTPSLKGVLRFWWRATCGISDLKKLKERESAIFGDTANKARFSVLIDNVNNAKPILKDLPKGRTFPVPGKNFRVGIIDYLAIGLRDTQIRKYSRKHYPAGTRFRIGFNFADQKDEGEVISAFKYLVNFGGLGAKSRNGFGALSLKKRDNPSIVFDGAVKNFTSLSSKADLFLTKKTNFKSWEDALSEVGMAYKTARLGLEPKHKYNKRRMIAKPIVQDSKSKDQRHAKPYFLHVGKTSAGYYSQVLFMPYHYMAGDPSYSQNAASSYLEICQIVNNKIKEELSGGNQ